MKTLVSKIIVALALMTLPSALILQPSTAHAQGTAFTYQGRLNAGGAPVSGNYDLRFKLFVDPLGNNQAGSAVLTNAVPVANGLFTVALDFGAGIFNGSNYWLEVDVKTNGGAAYTDLSPLQAVTPTPYAIFAGNIGSGGLAAGTYGSAVTFNNAADQFTGVFTGNGAGVTNVNASVLNGLSASNFWQTAGNAGTIAGPNFVGTMDNQPLELRVNGQRALRLEPGSPTNGAPNVIGGSPTNNVNAGVVGATIGGGGSTNYYSSTAANSVSGSYGTVSGGVRNSAAAEGTVGGGAGNSAGYGDTTVGGGLVNTASGSVATVGGGWANTASGSQATVGGGFENSSGANYTTVGGGYFNQATHVSATVSGGYGNTASGDSAAVGGGAYNHASATGAVVTGGTNNAAYGMFASVGGGTLNVASTNGAVVTGGVNNTASGTYASVGGGTNNAASGNRAASGGGYNNRVTLDYATVSGGYGNTASGADATVPGGSGNTAGGIGSFAAGSGAQALNDGSFVWSDGTSFSSAANNEFSVHASGGVRLAADVQLDYSTYHNLSLTGGNALGYLYGSFPALGDGIHLGYNYYYDASGSPHISNSGGGTSRITAGYGEIVLAVGGVNTAPSTIMLHVTTSGVCVNGTVSNCSDRNVKQDFAPIDSSQILDEVLRLPVSEWSYKVDPKTRHVGPMAQDFYSAFNLGVDDKHIAPIDEGGLAFAAIQGLNQKLEEQNKQKDAEITELKARLDKLEQLITSLKGDNK